MALTDWIPSVSVAALVGLLLWLCRSLISEWLTRGVQHEFDTKLERLRTELRKSEEGFRAELRARETEIAALRTGALTAMTSRQVALDERRLEAVDQLWSAVTALSPARGVSAMLAGVKFEATAERATHDPRVRDLFECIGGGFNPKMIEHNDSDKARPFVSEMAWALFTAYQAIVVQAVVKLEVIKSGLGGDLLDKEAVGRLVKVALPNYEDFVDKYGDRCYHYLLDELEKKLLEEIRRMLAGVEADKASIESAREILSLSNELTDATERRTAKGNQPSGAIQNAARTAAGQNT